MADSDPISDATPHKRRRLNDGRGWDSQDDSGEEFTAEDFETVATMPLPSQQKRKLEYTAGQLHADLRQSSTNGRSSSPARTYTTQPTQILNGITQPTKPLATQTFNRFTQLTQPLPTTNSRTAILVDRSSPTAVSPSPKKVPPEPIRKAFTKPGGLLASAMAPPGTAFRRPLGVQPKPAPIYIDSDEEDPPVRHSSDDEEDTRGLSSNLRPTNFIKSGRGLDSTPNRGSDHVVKESPRAPLAPATGAFSGLMQEFGYSSSPAKPVAPAMDMATAYGSFSRRARPAPQVTKPSSPPAVNANSYESLDDIVDYGLRAKVKKMHETLPFESVQRCVDALIKKKGNVEDAVAWLLEDEEQDAPGEDDVDELSSTTPVARRGVAVSMATQSSQPVRPGAKQEIRAPVQTIAEKYGGSTQAIRRPSQMEVEVEEQQPRRRLLQGRRRRSPTPPSSPPAPHQPVQLERRTKQPIVLSDDDEEDADESDSGAAEDQAVVEISSDDVRLLKFFNDCSIKDLADVAAQPEDVAKAIIENRPFADLEQVRQVSINPTETKSGKASRARPIGEKIVDTCSTVWTSYDAIDELVKECEGIAKPIQESLKTWGINASDEGELQVMNLDEAHDSGIGTPASSSDDVVPVSSKEKRKGHFLGQPSNMNSEATLKDYQLVGLNWLNLLWSQKISCILADDMGLGKTCQVIAFLAHLQQQQVNGCSLVIVPGSTLENWLREFQYFAPSLSVQPYYGSQHERVALQAQIEENFDSIDVVVTTYDMAVKKDDNKFLRSRVDPLVCIYDEAHVLRNPGSDRYKQLTRIRSAFRVLLTGTPLQNNLKELVAILGFIMPEMFNEKKDDLDYLFQHKATTKDPTENAALLSSQRIARARSIITPFILRRKKHQVLDLPTKHSRVEYCDMTPSQANYYADLLEDAQQFFADKIKSNTKTSAKQSSNILMKLRKAAMHPLLERRLYDDEKIDKITDLCVKQREFGDARRDQVHAYLTGTSPNSLRGGDYGLHHFCSDPTRTYLKKLALKNKPWMDSGKIAVFRKLVTAFAKNGDRVLVFSQFTTMMDILEAVFETLNIKFMRLDGSTNMQIRQDMIDNFTDDESITVFMLSTRAGGAGINLAAANKVIVFDSGFNPQDDIQAENRAHRVGQTREVEVIRLVTRHTIDEQIHALGESKLALDARVAGEAAEDGGKTEKKGEEMVEKMFLERLQQGEQREGDEKGEAVADLKDAFKSGLESAGVRVASKQARF